MSPLAVLSPATNTQMNSASVAVVVGLFLLALWAVGTFLKDSKGPVKPA